MSYAIYYRKQFIKVSSNTFIPLMEFGTNNCTDCKFKSTPGPAKRARSWIVNTMYSPSLNLIQNKFEFIEEMERYHTEISQRDKRYTDDTFGYMVGCAIHSKTTYTTTWNDYQNYMLNGFKNAMTIEELLENGIFITVRTHSYYLGDNIEKLPTITINSTSHLIEIINKYETFYCNKEQLKCVTLDIIGYDRYQFNKKNNPKIKLDLKTFYVLKSNHAYFIRKSSKRYFESRNLSNSVKRFKTEKEAIKYKSTLKIDYNIIKIES